MFKILLLEGPDGNRYKATLLSSDIWVVKTFPNLTRSMWWETECDNYSRSYTDEKLKQTFGILAESETYIHPSNFIIHDAR